MKKYVLLLVGCILAFHTKAQGDSEKLLINENFQSWDAVASSTTETSISKKTDFSNETLVYKLREIDVKPNGWDDTRFNAEKASKGYLQAAKTATPSIELSPLASITKVEFVHGATGGSRGYQLWKKVGNGDWVSVSDAFANPSSGDLVSVNINEENVALKFTNLNAAQNAYLFDLRIYGNYVSSAPQVNLTTSTNIAGAGVISRSINSDTYDQGVSLTLTATPNFGYKFIKWTDEANNALSSDTSLEITLDTDKTIIAVFEAIATHTFNVKIEGSQWGKVSLSPEPINGKYEAGTIVTVSVVPNPVTTFSYWEDETSESSRTIQVTGDMELAATFDEIPFIVGWDFKQQEPRQNRKADFYSETTNTGMMNAYKEADNTVIAWLANQGMYSPAYACIRKWATDFVNDQRYFQASFSTIGYKNIQVTSMMGGGYQMYAKQMMQYSIDGEVFKDLTTVDLTAAYNSTWVDCNAILPSEAEDVELVYIRWIADKNSTILGSGNDGTALTNIFIFADKEFIPDLDAPILITTTPAEGSTTASAINGSVVLTFNEKVQPGTGDITLNGEVLTGVFGSKTATFKYAGLSYNTPCTFIVPAGALQDMSGNAFEGVTLNFTTRNRPQPIAKIFDAVIALDGSGDYTGVQEAINAAPDNSATPYLIYIKNGKYIGHVDIPVNKPFIRLIGQDIDNVIISDNRLSGDKGDGTPVYHVSQGATVVVNSANCYFENITFDNSYGFENRQGPQALAMYTNNDKIVLKNCKLRSYQDTYLTSTKNINDRHYLERCYIEGAVDYIYGSGDVFFEECTLFNNRLSGGYIVAPSHAASTKWGYVFNNCTLDGDPGTTVYLGRPWHNSPKTVYLNTTAKIDIYAAGWYYKMNAIPAIFADYGTADAQGNPVDLSQRIEDYEYDIKDENDVVIETIRGKAKKALTDEEAAQYTLSNVLQGDDNWDPLAITEATEAPIIAGQDGEIYWDAVDYAICYVIIENGEVIDFTIEPSYTPSSTKTNAEYQVQAVSEHGALSRLSNKLSMSTVHIDMNQQSEVKYYTEKGYLYIKSLPTNCKVEIFNLMGGKLYTEVVSGELVTPIHGVCIVHLTSDGFATSFKVVASK